MKFDSIDTLMEYIDKKHIKMIDFKFTGIFGDYHHITIPSSRLDKDLLNRGINFDGSSIPGFKNIESGDMVLIPDLSTALLDKYMDYPTIEMLCNVVEADTLEQFDCDPRFIACKAEDYLRSTHIADESRWLPEFEFYIFDSINYLNDINLSRYAIDSEEADWNTDFDRETNLGSKIPRHGGYLLTPPLDKLNNIRTEMVCNIEDAGIPVYYHHHEVGGPGQSEIELKIGSFSKICDAVNRVKYIIRMTALRHNKTVTFMPKPLYSEAGSGLHFHQQLFKGGKPLFYDNSGHAGLSDTAMHYIGGLLKHGRALIAITNPSTNSYKRLVLGFEAPVNLFFGIANRSAAIRIPKYARSPVEKRIEFRPPDATCNAYLAIAAQLLAGIDGILNKIDPEKEGFGPIDKNIFKLTDDERNNIKKCPTSLIEALKALKEDHEFLRIGEVFPKDFLDIWISKKSMEYYDVRNRPHPYEMALYYDV